MKKILILTATLLSLSLTGHSQNAPDFKSNIDWINNTIKEVLIGTEKFEQKFELLNPELTKLKFSYVKTDSKGGTLEESFDFYLADADENTVKMVVVGKTLSIVFDTKNKQKLIKTSKNGELQGYISTLTILAGEVDQARQLVDMLKNTIPPSRKEKQTWDNLNDALTWFNKNITDVAVEDKSYKQAFEYNQSKPYLIKFTSTVIDSKGSTSEDIYQFNFSDINKNLIDFKVLGKTLSVDFYTKSKQNLIKFHKNGELQNYTSTFRIYVDDVELARNIINTSEYAIPLCKTEFRSWQSATEAIEWLKQNIGEVSLTTTNYKQALDIMPGEAGIFKFTSIKTDSKSKSSEDVCEFYLPDMNENGVEFNISGKNLTIDLTTKNKEKVIKYTKDGILQNYTYSLQVFVDELEKAREMINAFQYAIPKRATGINTWSSAPDAIQWLNTNISDVTLAAKIEQDFEYDKNKATFSKTETDSKGNAIESKYEFYLSDINKTGIVLKVTGKSLSVSLTTTEKNKYIKSLKNNELQNYEYLLEINSDDVLQARNIMEAFKTAIPLSDNTNQMWGDKNSTSNWIKTTIREVNTGSFVCKQTIESIEGNPCKIKYTSVKVDSKGGESEEIYEFNMTDINRNFIDFSVSGKTITVNMLTNNKEKLIKWYKNGVLQNYAYNLSFYMDDIQEAKDIVAGLSHLITSCSQ